MDHDGTRGWSPVRAQANDRGVIAHGDEAARPAKHEKLISEGARAHGAKRVPLQSFPDHPLGLHLAAWAELPP
jgi:hypothetical protein